MDALRIRCARASSGVSGRNFSISGLVLMAVVCVTGASSFIGRHFVKLITSYEDVRLRLLVHQHIPQEFQNEQRVKYVSGDLLDRTSLEKLVCPGAIVVNLAYLSHQDKAQNIHSVENVLDACRTGGAERLVHISSADVCGRVDCRMIDETTPCNPVSEYEKTKFEIEQRLLNRVRSGADVDIVIVRPTAVFGPGGRNVVKLAREVSDGNALVNYVKLCIHADRNMNAVFVDNVTAAICFLAFSKLKVDRQIFIISDDESINNNYRFIESYLRKRFGKQHHFLPPFRVSPRCLAVALKTLGRSNTNPRRVYSCQKLIRLGFVKPVQFEHGLQEFADWYWRVGRIQKPSA